MEDDSEVLRVTVDELVRTFRSALLAVAPLAEQIKMYWTEEREHRDWEKLAQCLFEVFVMNPISVDRSRLDGELPLAEYDIDRDDFSDVSWIACRSEGGEAGLALVRLLSRGAPFDTVQAVVVEPGSLKAGRRVTSPLATTSFSLLSRARDRADQLVDRIEADD